MLFHAELRQILDVSTGQPCALHQHIPLFLRRRTFQVIYHMHLVNIGCEHVHLEVIKAAETSSKTKKKHTKKHTRQLIMIVNITILEANSTELLSEQHFKT